LSGHTLGPADDKHDLLFRRKLPFFDVFRELMRRRLLTLNVKEDNELGGFDRGKNAAALGLRALVRRGVANLGHIAFHEL
jgi:hypothetical protein